MRRYVRSMIQGETEFAAEESSVSADPEAQNEDDEPWTSNPVRSKIESRS
jgi:hypothetical protein